MVAWEAHQSPEPRGTPHIAHRGRIAQRGRGEPVRLGGGPLQTIFDFNSSRSKFFISVAALCSGLKKNRRCFWCCWCWYWLAVARTCHVAVVLDAAHAALTRRKFLDASSDDESPM